MLESGQNWELFGYDMRNLGRHWVEAWRDLLWEVVAFEVGKIRIVVVGEVLSR